ncbi:type IV pilus modification PilV family protein [Oceanisphaera pacifica]|uniref:Prepilin-type N-terminal cleavage/methylation domain-containing protein n=1 Tax=Oceanisphaera pacifica TaxID=2818389 RepID=A0ABS3NDV9_9GAMM|nr:type II secretion system protein [Oceanisphaera pacifica]MBO1518766.1 prepilin-type N-terminal cleavage/methylation domain-containing protein [Oceanisphaera pacifica]
MTVSNKQAGFSLFELVLGIVLLGILMAGSLAMLINLAPKTVDPAMEVRAAQLAQRLLNDISLQKYDHNNSHLACGTTNAELCTLPENYGPDVAELALADFNDVDDYDTTAICAASFKPSSCNNDWIAACWFTEQCDDNSNAYSGFMVNIAVKPHVFDTQADSAKQIEIAVRQPSGNVWQYAVLRGNYP